MQNLKDNIHQKLLLAGRKLVRDKGVEFLSARKLSDASGYSIGTIYNQFASMDIFIAEQNEITMSEIINVFEKATKTSDNFENLNFLIDAFSKYVLENREMWFLLYNFHLNDNGFKPEIKYKRLMVKMINFGLSDFEKLFSNIVANKKKVMRDTLILGIFAISSFLTTSALDGMTRINRNNICRIFLNTFLAGMTLLERK